MHQISFQLQWLQNIKIKIYQNHPAHLEFNQMIKNIFDLYFLHLAMHNFI